MANGRSQGGTKDLARILAITILMDAIQGRSDFAYYLKINLIKYTLIKFIN